MEFYLQNRKALVTGASKGLGLELVKGLLDEGAIVTLCARNRAGLESVYASFPNDAHRIFICAGDVSKEEDAAKCVNFAYEKMNGIDIVINNAGGVEKFASFFDLETNDWLSSFQLNTLSIVHISKIAYPFLKKSVAGRILNITSLTGLQPGVFSPHYSVCKAASINLTKSMANIMAKDNILVNAIAAGTFESAAWDRNIERVAAEQELELQAAREKEVTLASTSIPLGRTGNASDIMPLALLLVSDKSSWTTGACFTVDGGKSRCIH